MPHVANVINDRTLLGKSIGFKAPLSLRRNNRDSSDVDALFWFFTINGDCCNLFHYVHSVNYMSKCRVFSIKLIRTLGGYEKMNGAAVGIVAVRQTNCAGLKYGTGEFSFDRVVLPISFSIRTVIGPERWIAALDQ